MTKYAVTRRVVEDPDQGQDSRAVKWTFDHLRHEAGLAIIGQVESTGEKWYAVRAWLDYRPPDKFFYQGWRPEAEYTLVFEIEPIPFREVEFFSYEQMPWKSLSINAIGEIKYRLKKKLRKLKLW